MKKLLIKIPAIFALLITLFSFYTYVESFILVSSDIWIFSVLLAMFSILFYFIDAIISFVKAAKKIDTKFNLILAVVLILSIPMVVIFAGDGKDLYNIIWNLYYLAMVVLEIISIIRIFKIKKADSKT